MIDGHLLEEMKIGAADSDLRDEKGGIAGLPDMWN